MICSLSASTQLIICVRDCIPAPPLFIEEVAAKQTEEFINFRFRDFRLNDSSRTSNVLLNHLIKELPPDFAVLF